MAPAANSDAPASASRNRDAAPASPTPDALPPSPATEPVPGMRQLLEHYSALLPPLPASLQRVLDPPPLAGETVLREAFAERLRLYSERTGEQFPKPVRQQNLTLLQRLESLAPDFEAHIAGLRAWKLLAEAATFIDQRQPGRAQRRLEDAATLLAGGPGDSPLMNWLCDLETDLRHLAPPPPPVVLPRICSPPAVSLRIGEPFEYRIATEPPAESYDAEFLPAGLQLDAETGRITGIVRETGQHVIHLAATLAGQIGRGTLVLTVESPPPAPLLLVPHEAAAIAGEPFECSYVVWPAGISVTAEHLPSGIALDTRRSRLAGTTSEAGIVRVELTATAPGGEAHATLTLRIAPPPTPLPKPAPAECFTVETAEGRRLHVFAAPRVRLGRTSGSDLRVAACARGSPEITKALSGEISRHHAEIFIEAGELRLCDGWRDGGTPSTFGTFLDANKIPPAPGEVVRTGQVLRLTARPPSPTVPHWKIKVFTPADLVRAPAVIRAHSPAGSPGAWLHRLDALPDDVLLLASACDLASVGLCREPLWLWRTGEGFLIVRADGTVAPLEELTHAVEGCTLSPPGTVRARDLREALELASKP